MNDLLHMICDGELTIDFLIFFSGNCVLILVVPGRLVSRLDLTILWPLTATRKEEFLRLIIALAFALRVLLSRQIPYLTTGSLRV